MDIRRYDIQGVKQLVYQLPTKRFEDGSIAVDVPWVELLLTGQVDQLTRGAVHHRQSPTKSGAPTSMRKRIDGLLSRLFSSSSNLPSTGIIMEREVRDTVSLIWV